ncbi:hypothetical protein CC80DRAFT_443514 [Byssothecium circinans]|uniref:Uncharacterized protein n=1 Tax=Byssothecium circinans TaxID=147558 RepID=A0A6A5U8B3_9PLEO|nr:hypothetical protein CC80DRAFT_443514 [Byssothecium circinans]
MSALLNNIQSTFGKLSTTFQNMLNKFCPPEKRTEILSNLQQFAVNNPKLAGFLTAQIAFTGIPLLLFLTFSVTVFLFSLMAALLIGLVAALLFTVFMVGIALIVVLPTVFLTTFGATFVFLWGLGGYYLLKWINDGKFPAPKGSAVGDKINDFTGGRIGWLRDGARKKQEEVATGGDETSKDRGGEKKDVKGSAHENGASKKSPDGSLKTSTDGQAGGGAKKPPKLAESPIKHTETVKDTSKNEGHTSQ